MTDKAWPARRAGILDARAWALVSGMVGVGAGLLLLVFFGFAEPYSPWSFTWGWPGPTNDIAVAVQFAAFAPAAWELRHRLPATRGVRALTAPAVVAMLVVAVLQALLAVGAIPFELEIGPAIAAFLLIYTWLLVSNLAAHRLRSLPRPLTRAGVLLGAAFPAGMLLAGAGVLAPGLAGWLLLGLGVTMGSVAWLALPVFPLLLARHVFPKATP